MNVRSRLLDSWPEIGRYLDEVLDLEPEKREAWLAELATRSPSLATSLRTHLRELDELKARHFMDVAIPEQVFTASLAGQRFGAYTLERAIGHGGMGTVWLARRSDGQFEGCAAVKLLNMAAAGLSTARRLAREGGVLARLQHPNIAHLIDAGVGPNGQPYLVLEHVRGQPIDQYCAARRLDIRARLTLFLDVLSAVAHAHSHLVVHRDLKPSNILVTEDGVVKLLDFGVAALLAPSGQNAPDLSQQLAPGLTPGYAAPEQLRGDLITTATDVYALGALLFLLLTGRHPSLGQENSREEWLRAVLEHDAPRPSDAAHGPQKKRQLRGDLDCIVGKAMRRLPDERYGTVGDFAQDLRRYLALEPVAARSRTFAYLAAMFARRHRAAVATTAGALVMLAVAMAVTTQLMLEARHQRDHARFQSSRAEASIDFLTHLMRLEAGTHGRPPGFHERLALGVEMLKRQYQDDPRFAGRMLVDLADYYGNDGETTRANELYARAYELGIRNGDTELVVAAQCGRASGDAYAGIREGNEERIQEGMRLLEQIPDAHVSLHVTCLLAQVAFEAQSGNLPAAEGLLERAMAARERADGTIQTVPYATLLTERGALHFLRARPREALIATEAAADIYERNGRGRMAAGLSARFTLSTILTDMGELRRALEEREIIWQRLHEAGESKAEHVAYPVSHALLLLRMGKTAAAHDMLAGVVERARRAGNPSWLAWALLCTAQLALHEGRPGEAGTALEEVRASPTLGGDTDIRLFAEAYAAELAMARSDFASARRHRATFLEIAGYQTPKGHRALARVLLIAARIALVEGAARDAERFARDALAPAEAKSRGRDTSGDVGEALLRLAQARLAQDTGSDVLAILRRADRSLTQGLGADHPLTLEARKLIQSRSHASSGR